MPARMRQSGGLRRMRTVQLAFYFAHARRKFWDVQVATKSPTAAEALQRIAMFYAIEDRIGGLPATHRAAVRQTDTRPLIEDFKPWLEARLLEVSKKSGLGKAIRHTINHSDGLTRFIDDGRIEIDSNTVERSIKAIGLERRTICSSAVKAAPRHGPCRSSTRQSCKTSTRGTI
ncbi:IS66 family transposase [Bradyrhizobium cenepequi]|uniref:IS66 family transposase n=1 Tax=Bradyrhizobium cenepequi TaxID=2821403 RepID=UPI001CE3A236|nr:IS66 family transposase [Bradyrhizobium cenepequi]